MCVTAQLDVGSATVSIVILSIAFVVITALFHFAIYAIRKKYYARAMTNRKHPLRWIEYSITATIMILLIALTVGCKSFSVLALLMVCTVVTMLLGLAIERCVVNDDASTARLLTGMGWLLTALSFVVLGKVFIQTMTSNKNTPAFVPAVFVSMLVLFASFGVVQAIYISGKVTFVRAEYAYVVLSFVSKTLLVMLLFSGVMAR